MAVKHKVIECQESGDESHLNVIIRVLERIEQQQQGVPCQENVKICEKIVEQLGTIAIPSDPHEFAAMTDQVCRIQEVLTKALAHNDMVVATLRAFYNEISNPQKQPAPTMAIVLELIDVQCIPKTVIWILQSGYQEVNIKQAFNTLCTWLTKWTYTPNLGPLVLDFMRGLETEQQFDILIEVSLKHIERLFRLVIIQDFRKSLGGVVLHILSSMKQCPEAFHKIIPHAEKVLETLDKENSDSSRLYLQNVVNLCVALMDQFPGYSKYDQLRNVLQRYKVAIDCKQYLNCKSWVDKSRSTVALQYTQGKVGLNNLGNTCYMNSILQALFMTKSFRNDILLLDKVEAMPVFSKLQILFALLQYSQRPSLSPNDVSSVARPPGFQPGHQYDSSEFLGYLLDMLHEQEKSFVGAEDASTSSGNECDSNISTVVKKSFGGKTLTLSQCSNCRSRSERVDTFRDLQLSFPTNTDNQSVQSLIDYYLQPEKLCGDNQYHCESCKGLTDGERVTRILEPPSRLVLTLKHFRYDPVSQLRTKILQRVQLDNKISVEKTHYMLYAAVVHCGSSVDSGHYYTYAKDDVDWYKFNDCFVNKSKAEELHGLQPPESPYILFYRREDCNDPEPLNRCDLSDQLQAILVRADADVDKRRTQLGINKNRPNRNNDDPPPPGCGGGTFNDFSHNRYVC